MRAHLRPAMSLIAIFTLLTGLALPVAFTGFGAVVFPNQAGGSLISRNGVVVGSALIGQNFVSPRYFWGRPSALMGADPKDARKQIATPYDASISGASNLAPTAKALIARLTGDIAKTGQHMVPADAVTTSGSGLDPDISPQNAAAQIARVAAARHLPQNAVRNVVARQTRGLEAGLFGAPRINVLALNLALDDLHADAQSTPAQAP